MEEKWDHVFLFVSKGQYPPALTKVQKLSLKRYSRKFTLKEGELFVYGKKAVKNKSEAKDIFHEFHRSPMGEHTGIIRTRQAISSRFYWKGMSRDIEAWVQECDKCQRVGKPLNQPNKRRSRKSRVSHPQAPMMQKKVLIDADCGVDDAQAIMLVLAAPNTQLLGVTCVHGNTTLENVCKNTLRVLQACNKLEVPVFKGAAQPILGKCISAGHFHGEDGLGDAPDPNAPSLDLVQEEGAVSAMIRIVNENPGEVSLVATAPLTNLALAVKLDPSFPSKLRGLYIMGGNTESRGNTTVCAEFNFAADPEAAYIVLNEYRCPTYLACWEFTCYSKLSWEFCDVWLEQKSDKARFMGQIFRHSMDASKSSLFDKEFVAGSGFISCDSYAAAAAVDDSFVLKSDCYPVSVELTGTHTRGMMVVDTLDLLNKSHTVTIMKKVDMKKFQRMMMAALK